MNPQDRINELTDKLNYYTHKYYQEAISEISDEQFDFLLKELENLEAQYPEFIREDSPSHRVGGSITKNFEAVEHKYPMLSLSNTYNEQELIEWDERVKKGLNDEPYEYICEIKFDGISLSMTYENGILKRAVTRGDGARHHADPVQCRRAQAGAPWRRGERRAGRGRRRIRTERTCRRQARLRSNSAT